MLPHQAKSGLAVLSGTAVMTAAAPAIAAVAALGTAVVMICGASTATEGLNLLTSGKSYNPVRDTAFKGNQALYDIFRFAGVGILGGAAAIPVIQEAFIKNSDRIPGTASNSINVKFKSQEMLQSHYNVHGQELAKMLEKQDYSIADYLDDANWIINSGTYSVELNGYVRFISGSKYGFVGLDRLTGQITTFHIKTVDELIRRAPSLGFGK